MVKFLSIIFFLGFLQFLLGFSKFPFFCVTLYFHVYFRNCTSYTKEKWQDYSTLQLCILYSNIFSTTGYTQYTVHYVV